uniref:Disease resistance protein winged helix domain-containing protein n=3 Tax=Manihot esculenta TaxID=3983 RepID=A0A2C9U2I8_MANES
MLTIKPLKNEEAWDLFCMKAFFINPDKSCPEELKPLALELVGKCDGLPLAIVALGGVMSSKKSTSEWSSVWDSLNWQLNNNPRLEIVKSILLLSFNYLPSPLKYCFLYCCLFPEDYKIRRERLIRLWIAEGFIQNVDRTTPNEVAERYFMELTLCSMLQVGSRNACGRPRACQIHDLLREIGISMLEREKFGVVYDGKIKIKECQLHQTRRLSIQITNGDLQSYGNMRRLRSLLVFVDSFVSFSNTSLSNLKLMRSLDLENVAINISPEGLGTLFNLRYLNLRGT